MLIWGLSQVNPPAGRDYATSDTPQACRLCVQVSGWLLDCEQVELSDSAQSVRLCVMAEVQPPGGGGSQTEGSGIQKKKEKGGGAAAW